MTSTRLSQEELSRLRSHRLDCTVKGIPPGVDTSLEEIGNRRWSVARGDLALPVVTLNEAAVNANLDTMMRYCARHKVWLAPHGKTTMSPQLFDLQLAQGAWAITCGTPSQAGIMRQFGTQRILMANELPDAQALRWVADELRSDAQFEFYCLVDSVETVTLMDDVLRNAEAVRPIHVLIEVGPKNGRGGVRNMDQALEVGSAVHESNELILAGVEAYEGLVTAGGSSEDILELDVFFDLVRSVLMAIDAQGLFAGTEQVIVTAGGSSYFDRVVARLSDWPDTQTAIQLVLRSGCYVSQDADKYERLSPLAGRQLDSETLRLVNALTGWATVLSTPEPNLVILGGGKRDFPYDVSLPAPRTVYGRNGNVTSLETSSGVFKMMDQHTFIRLNADAPPVQSGDIVALDLSHPCTAFDKNRLVYVVNDDLDVVDGILTFF